MTIGEPQTLADFLKRPQSMRWIAHPSGDPIGRILRTTLEFTADNDMVSIAAAVGPEGGFTEGEVDAARAAGAAAVSLGRTILRVETAALAIASVVHTEAN